MPRIITLLLLVSSSVYGQISERDSLYNIYSTSNIDSIKIKALGDLCRYYYYNDVELAKSYLDTLTELAHETNNGKWYDRANRMSGSIKNYEGDYKGAIEVFQKSIDYLDEHGPEEEKYASYHNMGVAYTDDRQFDIAEESIKKAIDIVNRFDKKDKFLNAHTTMGNMFIGKEDYQKAVEYYTLALTKKEFCKSNRSISNLLTNLGNTHYLIGQYDQALSYNQQALHLATQIKNAGTIAFAKLNIAKCFIVQKTQSDSAIVLLHNALDLFTQTSELKFLSETHEQLGMAYTNIEKLSLAESHYRSALNISQSMNMPTNIYGGHFSLARVYFAQKKFNNAEKELDILIENKDDPDLLKMNLIQAYDLKSKIRHAQGDDKNAYEYAKLYKTESDNLYQTETTNRINELQTQYETVEKDKANAQLTFEKTQQEQKIQAGEKRQWLLGGGLLTAILGLGVFGFYYQRNKRQKELIEKLQGEVHHNIKNNLTVINAFIENAKRSFSNKAFNDKLRDLQNRIESINSVHKLLYNSSDITAVNSQKYVTTLVDTIQKTFSSSVQITTSIAPDLKLDSSIAFKFGILINEFVTNSLKHAFDDPSGNEVHITLQEQNNSYHLTMKDNGKGFLPEELNQSESFGLSLLELIPTEFNGTSTIDSSNGVSISIKIPKQ